MVDLEFLLARRKINVSEWLSEKGISDRASLLTAIKDVGAAAPSEAKILELLSKVKASEAVSIDATIVDEPKVVERKTRKSKTIDEPKTEE